MIPPVGDLGVGIGIWFLHPERGRGVEEATY